MSTIRLNFKDPRNPGRHLDVKASSVKEAVELLAAEGNPLRFVDLRGVDLSGLELEGCDLSYADLSGANLTSAKLENVVLNRASMCRADLSSANICDAAMDSVDMCEARGNAYIKNVYLSNADLYNADLSGSTLYDVTMNNTYLVQISFRGSRLIYVSLHQANMNYADCRGVDMVQVDFDHTCIQRVCFEGAKLDGRELWVGKDARPILQLGPCGGHDRQTVAFFFADGGDPLIRCGCFRGTIKDFRRAIQGTHGGTFFEDEYRLLANHIAGMHRLQKKQMRK